MPQGMQQKNREHDETWLKLGKLGDQMNFGSYRKDEGAEQEIDRENIHLRRLLPMRLTRLRQTVPPRNC